MNQIKDSEISFINASKNKLWIKYKLEEDVVP